MAVQICPALQACHGIYLEEGITQLYTCWLHSERHTAIPYPILVCIIFLGEHPCSPEMLQVDEDWNQPSRISALTSILKDKPVISRICTRPQLHAMATKFKCASSKLSLI